MKFQNCDIIAPRSSTHSAIRERRNRTFWTSKKSCSRIWYLRLASDSSWTMADLREPIDALFILDFDIDRLYRETTQLADQKLKSIGRKGFREVEFGSRGEILEFEIWKFWPPIKKSIRIRFQSLQDFLIEPIWR